MLLTIPATLWRVAFWFSLSLTSYLSLLPQEFLPPGIDLWDKLSHAIAFAALAISALLGWPERAHIRTILLPLFLYGVLVEVVQYFIPGRQFSLLDMLADAVGIIIGTLFVFQFLRLIGHDKGKFLNG